MLFQATTEHILYTVAFGHKLPWIVVPGACRLKCQDPQIVQRYVTMFEAYIQHHRLADWAFALQLSCTSPLSQAQASKWEAIDYLQVQGMLSAEHPCCRLCMGTIPWSPAIRHCMDTIALWQLVCKRHRGARVGSKVIL